MRELIILAMGPSRAECPFDAEVWSVNTGYYQIARLKGHINKIFLAHGQVTKVVNGQKLLTFWWDDFNQLADAGIEIINIHKVPELKSKLYPLQRISEKFGCDYFSNTLCYMIAYALDQSTYKRKGKVVLKYPFKLRLYGCDMRDTGEYALEKGGIEYWIGYARGLGVIVENTEFSVLCKTVTYAPYGTKDFDHTKFAEGGSVIIGWDGAVYGQRQCANIGTSCGSPPEGWLLPGDKVPENTPPQVKSSEGFLVNLG